MDGKNNFTFLSFCCKTDRYVRSFAMKASEFVRLTRRYAKRKDLEFRYDPRKGKGSHGRVYVGERLTAIKGSNKSIGVGLLKKMLKDLNIDPKDF